MKVYQIHEYGGVWEDRFDYIRYSYLDEEKAIDKLKELEEEEKLAVQCRNCPLVYCPNDCDKNCNECNSDRMKEMALKRCNRFIPLKDEDGEWICNNDRYNRGWDDSYFKICEVEVIE